MDFQERLASTKAKLDAVSPSFCLAKWLQVTMHLQNGYTHSCHHPNVHKIPLDALKLDPSALHNTPFKKELRKQMLEGKRPSECDYCWRVEDTPGNHFSDRTLKSSDDWAFSQLEKIAKMDPNISVNPSYLEVSFGNECNFRCSYCAPEISSSVWNSFEKHGPFVFRKSNDEIRKDGRAPISGEDNPYVKAFWDWFPSLAPDLRVFRITGGEPLINSNTFRVLEYIENNPLPNLQLCINSNFGVPERFFRKFIDKVSELTKAGKIRNFMMYTSVDTHGAHAEYLRVGLKYDQWLERVRMYLRELPWDITFMMTFNSLSVPRFPLLLQDMLEINKEFMGERDGKPHKRTLLDISHLMHPEYFSPWVLNEKWIQKISDIADLMESFQKDKVGPHGYDVYETHKMKRIATWAQGASKRPPIDIELFRGLFYLFTIQYEQREGKAFLDVFPEMADFYELCQKSTALNDPHFIKYHAPTAVDRFVHLSP